MNEDRRFPLILSCLALVPAFLFIELLKSHRSDYWSEAGPAGWLAVGAAAAIYALGTLALALAWRQALRAAFRTRPLERLSVLAGCVTLWVLLCLCREGAALTRADILLCALGVGIVLFFIGCDVLVQRSGLLPVPGFILAWVLAWAAGAATLTPLTELLLFHSRRAALVAAASSGYALLSALLIAGTWRVSRRAPVRAFVALGLLVLPQVLRWSPGEWAPPATQAARPSLLLITCDALRADASSVYGGSTPTPHIARLAEQGTLLKQCHAIAPWTLPAINGLFGSYYPPGLTPGASPATWEDETGQYWFPPEKGSFAEQLAAMGYATGAFVGNPLLRQRRFILRGFQTTVAFQNLTPERRGFFEHTPLLNAALARIRPDWAAERPLDTTRLITQCATTFVRQHSHQPFFLWLHYMDPHTPYDPPSRFRTRSGPWPLFAPETDKWVCPKFDAEWNVPVPEQHQPYVRSLYDAEVRYVDEHLGHVVATLEQLGLGGATYVCFSADHGEEFWEHGRTGHGFALYEEHLHVPLIIAGPGILPQVVETPLSMIDLMPSLADLLGVAPCADWRGTSRAAVLRGADVLPKGPPLFAQCTHQSCRPLPLQTVIADGFKLIRSLGSGDLVLYDLRNDPHERTDVSSAHPELTASLTSRLDEWAASFPATFSLVAAPADNETLRDAAEQDLRALGYVK